jgi:phosphoribosyl-ATP pyrophosphohydrolase
MTNDVVQQLAATIAARRSEAAANSYTRQLIDAGPERCARKLGEEATETIIAALGTDMTALTREAADLVYHLLVLLECREVAWADVLAELEARMGTSGLAEKAARGKPTPQARP